MDRSTRPDRRFLPVLTLKSCAAISRRPVSAIEQAIADGSLPSTEFVELVRKVSPADLEVWIQAHPVPLPTDMMDVVSDNDEAR